MKILLVNDDGIQSKGIARFAKLIKSLGEVTVVAPKTQCSGMSQRLTLFQDMELNEMSNFPVSGVRAFSLDGTPVDCVKVGLTLYPQDAPPDIIFSGINNGWNMGFDIAYSGTVGAAMEAAMNGIPAIAFSAPMDAEINNIEPWFPELMKALLPLTETEAKVWNVNFPLCPAEEVRGILWDVPVAGMQPYSILYHQVEADGRTYIQTSVAYIAKREAQPGTDVALIAENYITVSVHEPIVKPYRG